MALQKPIATTGHDFTRTLHHDTYPLIRPNPASAGGLRVFITGASKGIGRATALSYARGGAAVIGLGARSELSDLEAEIREEWKAVTETEGKGRGQGPKVVSVKLDVQDRKSVEEAARVVEREMGCVDVLVNNAGYLETWKPIGETDPDEWWKTWEVNIKGPYLMTRSFLPLLLASKGKTILNISSGGAHYTSYGGSAYQSTKFALLRLSEFTNAEYGEQGILTYSLHPGGVVTQLSSGLPQEMQARILKDKAELASDTFVYLTRKREEWLAGRYIDVRWDMEEFFGMKEEIVGKDLLRVRLATV